jgi:colanic acid/amylovoran biosynthesis glycosyltransferase
VSAPVQRVVSRTPILHAVHRFGLPSETFIRDAIGETEALGWPSWVVTERLEPGHGAFPGERIVVTGDLRLPDRVGARMAIMRGGDPIRERSARKYLRALQRMPAGLLHAHFGWTATDCVLAARRLGLPFLVSFHGTDLTAVPHDPAWAPSYVGLLERADGVTVVSRFLERKLRELGYGGGVDLIPAGVQLERFPFTGGPRPGDAPRLLFVGRLHPGKGVDVLLRAFARVRATGLPATLRIAGDGELRDRLEAAAVAERRAGVVRFLGMRPHDDVCRELQEADIVVVPSQVLASGVEEGSPVVCKEAQAVGVPVVATRVGGIPESLPPELRDELVPPDDDAALADRIVRVWHDRAHWPIRVARQREWIVAEFAWDRIARRLSDVYERLLAEAPAAQRTRGRR